MILLAKGDTQWQAVDSCSVHDPHDASLDFVTHYYVDDPSYGFGGDAADLDFGSDYFSACDDPGLDYDFGQKWLLSSFKNKPTSSLMYTFPWYLSIYNSQNPSVPRTTDLRFLSLLLLWLRLLFFLWESINSHYRGLIISPKETKWQWG